MPDFEQAEDWASRPHVVLVVDESGSMAVSRETTISSINDYLQGLKTTLPPESRVTVVKFDSGYHVARPLNAVPLNAQFTARANSNNVRIEKLFDQTPLKDVRALTTADYTPTGGTPLYDAIGRTMTELDATLRAHPAPVYFAILTDGEENSSTEFKLDTVKSLIEQRRQAGWTISFMGVNIDAYAAGRSFGISVGDTISVGRDKIYGATMSMARSIGDKFATASSFSAKMGAGAATAYATWNAEDATFKDADKKELETKTET